MTDPTDGDERARRDPDPRTGAWDDVAAHLSNLGQQVRDRFEQQTADTRTARDAGGETVRRWIDTLDDAFTSLGDAVRDPAFRREAESSVGRLADALGTTLSELGDELQQRFGQGGAGHPEPPSPPPPGTGGDAPPPPPHATGGPPSPPPSRPPDQGGPA